MWKIFQIQVKSKGTLLCTPKTNHIFVHCVVNYLDANQSSQATLLPTHSEERPYECSVAKALNIGQTFVITGVCMLRMGFLPATYVVIHLAISPI